MTEVWAGQRAAKASSGPQTLHGEERFRDLSPCTAKQQFCDQPHQRTCSAVLSCAVCEGKREGKGEGGKEKGKEGRGRGGGGGQGQGGVTVRRRRPPPPSAVRRPPSVRLLYILPTTRQLTYY